MTDATTDLEETLQSLGAAIAKSRLEHRLTVQELARDSGVSPLTVYRIENGSGGVATQSLFAVLHVLNLDVLRHVVDTLPRETLPLHHIHVSSTDVQERIAAAARVACQQLEELFPGVAPEVEGITSNFQGLLEDHLTAMLCGRPSAQPTHRVVLPELVYSDDMLGREYSLAEGASGFLVRLLGTNKVLDNNRFCQARRASDMYTSWDGAAMAVREYLETHGHLPGPVRIVSGWFSPDENGGVRFTGGAQAAD